MKIHWSGDPSKAPKSSFTKHIKNQAKINKSFILGTSKTSKSSKSFYNVFWKPSCGNHLTVSGDPKSASRPIFATSLKRYKNTGLDTNSTSWDASRGTNMSILPRTCKKSHRQPVIQAAQAQAQAKAGDQYVFVYTFSDVFNLFATLLETSTFKNCHSEDSI